MTNATSVRYEIIFFFCVCERLLFKAHGIFDLVFYMCVCCFFFNLIYGKENGRGKISDSRY